MIYITLFLLCILFIELFILFDINSNIKSVLHLSREAFKIIMSTELDDEEKEKLVRKSSLDIFKATLLFLTKVVLVFLVLYVVYKVLLLSFSLSEDRIIEVSFFLHTIVSLTLMGLLYSWLRSVIIRRLQSH